MNTREKILFLIKPKNIMLYLVRHKPLCYLLTDKLAIKIMFRLKMGEKLNLNEPKTFNEKVQWLKLYGYKEAYDKLVDKIEVRKYVKEKIGKEYLIPLIGIWNNFSEIDFDNLPSAFVLKGAQNGVYVCKNKANFDKKRVSVLFRKYSEYNFFYLGREPVYKNIRNRLICERYMKNDETGTLVDYKFFCANGVVKAMFVATDRGAGTTKFDFYDAEFNHLDFVQHYPNAQHHCNKPKNFEKMKVLSQKLSNGIPFVRVDLYEINGKVYFGEMTFYHFSGFEKFEPAFWDSKFGEMIKIK